MKTKYAWCIVVRERTGWDSGDVEIAKVFYCHKDFELEDFKKYYPKYMDTNSNYDVSKEIIETMEIEEV